MHEYEDGRISVLREGKRKLGVYDREGKLLERGEEKRRVVV